MAMDNQEFFRRSSSIDEITELRELLKYSIDGKFASFFNLKPGDTSEDKSVICGRNLWLFINDGSNRWGEQIKGIHPNIDVASEKQCQLLAKRAELLQKAGIKYLHIIIPEKDILYPELSPSVDKNASENRVAINMMESALGCCLYLGRLLLKQKEEGYLFHARNSHVNFFGGYFIAQAVVERLNLSFPSLNQIETGFHIWPDDLSIKFAEGLTTTRRVLKPCFNENKIASPAGHVGTNIIFTNDSALYDKKVLIFGDSYSWNPDAGLARFLALIFKEVNFFWSTAMDFSIIKSYSPNIVLTETAERFLIKCPEDIYEV